MTKIETAVFLAAGLGSRLKGMSNGKPKGFLEIEGISLIERSVNKLLEAGIKRFYFGTGFASEVYDEFTRKYDAICIRNNVYASTGSMYTLYNMQDRITSDFILLEADLLYDKSGLSYLMDDAHADVILASGKTNSGDEVFMEIDGYSNLINMSKDSGVLKSVNGELVGISKVSLDTYDKMCVIAESLFLEKPKLDYEYVFVELSKTQPMFVKKVEDYVWCEIDDESHYRRALDKIYPKIQ